jgi:methyl-accepting chemotaxis protein
MAAAGIIMVTLLIWLTVQSDKQEAVRESELAQLIISNRLDFMVRNQSDYATWDDAVAKLVLTMDGEWANDNIGPYLFHTQGYEHSFVINAHDQPIYASDRDYQAKVDPFTLMGPTLRRVIQELRRKPTGEDHRLRGLIRIGNQPAVFSIAAISPDPGKVKLPPGPASYLLFIDVLTPDQIASLGADRRLSHMRFLPSDTLEESRWGRVELRGYNGEFIGNLVWTRQLPGTALRNVALPILLLIVLVLGLIGARILRHCRRAIQQTNAATLRSAADADEARNALDALTLARADAASADAAARVRLETTVAEVRRDNAELNERLKAVRQAALIDAKTRLEQRLGPAIKTIRHQGRVLETASKRVRDQAGGLQELVTVATTAAAQTDLHMTELVPKAVAFAEAGQEIQHKTGFALSEVKRASSDGQQVGASVAALAKALGEIETVVDAIDRVSKQTNLLALNASIEAARSGIAGAGFAVVANEVKALANHTAELTRQVAAQLDQLRAQTITTSTSVDTIVAALGRTEAASGVIATAVHRQVDGVLMIRGGIEAVADESKATAAAVTSASSAIAIGNAAADQMDAAVTDLSSTLSDLGDDINRFLRQLEAA